MFSAFARDDPGVASAQRARLSTGPNVERFRHPSPLGTGPADNPDVLEPTAKSVGAGNKMLDGVASVVLPRRRSRCPRVEGGGRLPVGFNRLDPYRTDGAVHPLTEGVWRGQLGIKPYRAAGLPPDKGHCEDRLSRNRIAIHQRSQGAPVGGQHENASSCCQSRTKKAQAHQALGPLKWQMPDNDLLSHGETPHYHRR